MKTLPTYTRGPWQYFPNEERNQFRIADAETAQNTIGWSYKADDARLIAAAPDLLTMCGMALDILLADGYGETSHPVMNLRKVINQAIGE